MAKFIAAILLWALSSCDHGVKNDDESLSDLATNLRKIIPAGWKVSINHFHDPDDDDLHLEVWRSEKVMMRHHVLPNANPKANRDDLEEPVKAEFFYFNFYLTDYLSPNDYKRLTEENAVIEARLADLTKALSDVNRHGKARASGDTRPLGYFPKTESDKRRVQELIDYERSHPKHHIPQDYFHQKMSFIFHDPRDSKYLESKEVDLECNTVLKAIMEVFQPYKTSSG